MFVAWRWKRKTGYRMINKVASTFRVGVRVQCLANCTVSPICDSYNYRPADKTCQLNTHDTQHTLDSCVHTGSGLVLLTRRASSTHTTLRSSPTRPTSLPTTPGAGGAPRLPSSFEGDQTLRLECAGTACFFITIGLHRVNAIVSILYGTDIRH